MRKKIAGIAAAVLVIFAAAAGIYRFMPTAKRMSADTYFGFSDETEEPTFGEEDESVAAVIVDGTLMPERALASDGEIYIDYTLVQRELNSRFYWDDSEGVMLFTTPEELYEIGTDTSWYTIDQEGYDAGYEIVRTASTGLFFSAQFLQDYSDLTFAFYEADEKTPARLIVTLGSEEVKTAEITKTCRLRFLGGIKSQVLTDLDQKQPVTVMNQMEHWSQVTTADGYTGYVRNRYLGGIEETVTETTYKPEYTSIHLPERVNLAWHEINYEEMNTELSKDLQMVSGVNVLSPTWYYLSDNDGAVLSYADADYIKEAHEAGYQVWPLISNFSSDVSTTTILQTRWARRSVEHYLVDQALELGFDGINIDFESIAEEAGYAYVQFLRELSILCRVNGIILSVDIPTPYSFNAYYNRKELGIVCDYVIMMGYDEHYVGSDAGSVASLSFEEDGIVTALKDVPAEKLISGIPFYSRIWSSVTYTGGDVEISSEIVSMDAAQELLLDLGVASSYDEKSGQNYAEWTDEDGAFCQIWLEDEMSVKKRAALVADYDLGGIAEWRLGQGSAGVWEIIEEEIS